MKVSLFAVVSAVLFFLAFLLFRPHPAVLVFVWATLAMTALTVVVSWVNVRARTSVLPVSGGTAAPEIAVAKRLADMGFKRVERFLVPTLPETSVEAFRHGTEPVFAGLSASGGKSHLWFISFLAKGCLITMSNRKAATAPRPDSHWIHLVQVTNPGALLAEHRNALRILDRLGESPLSIDGTAFRSWYLAGEREAVRAITALPFWPLRAALWTLGWDEAQAERRVMHSSIFSVPEPAVPVPADAPLPDRNRYRIVFRGTIREGFSPEAVHHHLTRLFRLKPEVSKVLFSGASILVRKDADSSTVRAILDAFHGAGAVCDVETVPSSATGTAVEEPVLRDRINALLAADAFKHEKEKAETRTLGWWPYVLAVSSFLPMWGIAAGAVSMAYGLSMRRSGGLRIALVGFVGLFVSTMSSITMMLMQQQAKSVKMTDLRVLETGQRLNQVVSALESYR
jgi:hypothetical protein